MTLLKEYLKSQILKLEDTKVQEIQAKSNILVQNYFKISKADLYMKDIPLSAKDITHLDSMFDQLSKINQFNILLVKLIFIMISF